MVPPRREKKPQSHDDPVEPAPDDGHENATEAQKTRGKDQTARDMGTEESKTRGRDQTAREMAQHRQK